MTASTSDHFRRASSGTTRPVVTYLASDKTNGSTTAVLNAVTGWNTTTGVDVIIYRIDTSGAIVAGTQTDWIATLAGSTLSNMELKAGTEPANGYPAGTQSVVIASPTAAWGDSLVEGILVEHNQEGTHVMARPKVTTSIDDTNGNELIKVSATASAVNEVTVTNAATGNAPSISATGGDTNVDVRIIPKGTGNVKRGATGGAIDWWEELGRATLGTAGDTITLNSLPVRKYLQVYVITIDNGSAITSALRFNNDSAANYSFRTSLNGAADATFPSQFLLQFFPSTIARVYTVLDIINIAGQEKIVYARSTSRSTAGAANVPDRQELSGKWANTTDAITRIDIVNTGAGDFAAGSEVVVLGHD